AAIWHCLNHYAYSDAIFLAERLYAEVDTDEALFLLATCYYRSGKPRQAYSLLHIKGCRTAQCKYLFARCSLDLNKLSEAEAILSGTSVLKVKTVDDLSEFGDGACFAVQLLARIYGKTERLAKASDSYKKSLKLNPFLWSSYASLCNMGEKVDPTKVFQLSHLDNLNTCHGTNFLMQLFNQSASQPLHTSVTRSPILGLTRGTPEIIHEEITPQIASIPPAPLRSKFSLGLRSIFKAPLNISPFSPSFGVLPLESPCFPAEGTGQFTVAVVTPASLDTQIVEQKAVGRKSVITRRSQAVNTTKPSVFSQSGNTGNVTHLGQVVPLPQPSLSTNANAPRRSSRLFSSSNSVKENNESSSKSRFSSPKTPPRKSKPRSSKNSNNNNNNTMSQTTFNELNELNKSSELSNPLENKANLINSGVNNITYSQHLVNIQKATAEGLMTLMQELGKAYLNLTQFNCQKAVDLLTSLSTQHINTGWVLSHLGRAYFELSEYQQAVHYFSEQQKMEPHRLEGLEYYSTALWHLQKEVELSALAQELSENYKESGEAWCAAGNCFSLQKEHDTAVKFFQRAVLVEPNFAYAYTLLGHEYVITEELDKAMSCFRNAIRIDPRHYNAWYGIGMIYYKQEKFQFAEFHFKKALIINPQSSVLMCHIAVVQHALQKTELALATLNRAISADPKNPLCKFHRASIYFASDRHNDALQELLELKELVPKESLVYFLIGKVHKKLGNTHLALMNFSWAMDLDPKGANNQIKEEIDRRYANEDDEFAANHDMAATEANNAEELSHEGSTMDAEDAQQQQQAMESDE
uniref:Cell division cycle protein 27 homolog n=1 Tax=Strigamia maritima TaxID=126957 RepID=T1JEI7_STRMM